MAANSKRTILLALLLAAAAFGAGAAWSRLSSCRWQAGKASADLVDCRAKFAAIDSKSAVSGGISEEVTIDRRLAGASVALNQQLASTDFGNPVRVGESSFTQTPVYVRLNTVTLRQLVGFLIELTARDDAVRIADIDLQPPVVGPPAHAEPGDRWTADLTLSYLAFSPKGPADR